ncbi:SusC/RagA family TonB-linked outer membrane protein [Bacteroidales bacterium]|nr:SusC/RagA family TonB-linked outer membrane protein [Bacteroidales bacterium]
MKRKFTAILMFLVFCSGLIFAQNRNVRGNVISTEDGDPIIGASVSVKGTTIGTVTDFDGNFNLSVPDGTKKITFTYVGMSAQEVNVQSVMAIRMDSDAKILGEVVVTGYQKIDRRLFTGSAEKLSANDAKLDGVPDISRMLQGRVAGVSVQNVSGTFGAAPKLKVRGASSIYGNQSPLWVVDGVILEDIVEVSADQLSSGDPTTLISSAVAGLNADDIEDFQILKDASASALYGARAMNGVIVITTKKGKAGSTSVSYNGEFTTRLKPSYRDYNILNSQDQMGVYQEMQSKGWLNYSDAVSRSNSGLYGYMYSLRDVMAGQGVDLANFEYNTLREAEFRNTDWFNELFRSSIVQNHSLSMTSGSEKNRNYSSLSVYNDPGWTQADKVERFTGNFNSTTDISNTLTSVFSANGSIRKQRAPGSQNRRNDVVTGSVNRDFDINPYSYALKTARTADPRAYYRMNYAPFNEIQELENNYLDISMIDLKFQIDLSWKPIKGLEFGALGAYRYVKSTTETKIGDYSNMAMAYRADETSTIAKDNKFLYINPDDPGSLPAVVLPVGGFYNREDFDMTSYYTRGSVNFNKTFDETHLTNIFVGAEAKSTERAKSSSSGFGYQWSQGGVPFTDYRILKKMLEGSFDLFEFKEYTDRSAAAFATGSYSYLGKYTVNAAVRVDGTNQLGMGAKDKWLPTWNVSAAWNAKEETFLADNTTISQLQFRTTYGLNAKPVPSVANALLILRNDVTYRPSEDKESSTYISSLQNDELTWEKQYEFNIGFDLGLWRNRISISADAYTRDVFDNIASVKTSGLGGQFYKWANYADMRTSGFEFSLAGLVFDISGVKWNSNLTFAYFDNKITSLNTSPSVFDLVNSQGGPLLDRPARGLYSFQFAGLSRDGFPQVINEDGEVTIGNVYFQERTKMGHLVYEGPIDAPYQGGWSNNFTYGNWGLSTFLTYQFGNVVRLDPAFSSTFSDLDVMTKEFNNRWTLPGDEAITNIPVIPSLSQSRLISGLNVAYNAYNYSTERVAKGDYIRLKEIFVTYKVPSKLVSHFHLSRLDLKFAATNIGLLYSDKKLNGQDPEFLRSGGVSMPNPRQFTLSLKVGL